VKLQDTASELCNRELTEFSVASLKEEGELSSSRYLEFTKNFFNIHKFVNFYTAKIRIYSDTVIEVFVQTVGQ